MVEYGSVNFTKVKEKKEKKNRSKGWKMTDWLRAVLFTMALCMLVGSIVAAFSYYGSGALVPVGCQTTLYLIRHGEKTVGADPPDPYLNDAGEERAQQLPNLFCGNDCRFQSPDVLVARGASMSSRRPVDMVTPLARNLSLTVTTRFRKNQALASFLLGSVFDGTWCGKTVLVCWKHSLLAPLAGMLGCASEKCATWDGNDFDSVWMFDFKLVNSTDSNKRVHWTKSFLAQAEGLNEPKR
ncbi:hypothetical protein NDN08_000144 [Rhodosorus marinus]|uniref:Uncharacterized protein n=1 Tax=Rhodosorus marinus TaxID=101924 RepID=A0AAV8UED9_9RHOD|nr:hypothetical protein NDN08_000144 [Rhodosorus marinus]